jgi:HlyD family secretion protein
MDIPVSGKSNRPLLWILVLLIGGIASLSLAIYKMVENPSPESEIDKITEVAKIETLPVEIEASGTVEPIDRVNISPKTPGRLGKLLVKQGQKVKQGQPLAVMENLEIQARGAQAQAKVKQAIANLKEAEVRIPQEINQAKARYNQAEARLQEIQARFTYSQENIPKDIEQAEAQRMDAQARLDLAQVRLKRNQSLLDEGAISQDEYDAALNEYRSAQANYFEAVKRREQLEKTASPEIGQIIQEGYAARASLEEAHFALEQRQKTQGVEIARLQAEVEAAQAELEQVKIQYQDTIIRAPFDGVVTQEYATEGAFVTPETSASTTASATSASILALARGLEVVAKVPEVDLSLLGVGQPVTILAGAYPERVFQGQVTGIAPEAIVEENVTSFEVKVGLTNGQDKLLSKMNVDVTFVGRQISDALVVPTVAIVTREGKTGVLVTDEADKPEFKPVKVGLVLDDKTEILSGLKPGDRVFVDLPEDLKEKEK